MRNSFTFITGISLCDGLVMYVAALISLDSVGSKPLGSCVSCCFCV